MLKEKFIWFNGKFIAWQKAKIHVLTHSLHYGSAVFEGIRFYETEKGPAIFRLIDHLNRLFYSAKTMGGMKIAYSKDQFIEAICELIKKNRLDSGYIRPIIFYGSKMGLDPAGADINIAIACWPWGRYLDKEMVKIKISTYQRLHPQTSDMGAKISGHYFNSILATIQAKKQGFDEALLLDYKGNIAEGPGENIFIVKNNKLYTPCAGAILTGITRDSVLKIAKDIGIETKEKEISVKELKGADEAFFCGTAVEICPIKRIDDVLINNGKMGRITKQIKEIYARIVKGKQEKYLKWLTFVRQYGRSKKTASRD